MESHALADRPVALLPNQLVVVGEYRVVAGWATGSAAVQPRHQLPCNKHFVCRPLRASTHEAFEGVACHGFDTLCSSSNGGSGFLTRITWALLSSSTVRAYTLLPTRWCELHASDPFARQQPQLAEAAPAAAAGCRGRYSISSSDNLQHGGHGMSTMRYVLWRPNRCGIRRTTVTAAPAG